MFCRFVSIWSEDTRPRTRRDVAACTVDIQKQCIRLYCRCKQFRKPKKVPIERAIKQKAELFPIGGHRTSATRQQASFQSGLIRRNIVKWIWSVTVSIREFAVRDRWIRVRRLWKFIGVRKRTCWITRFRFNWYWPIC